MERERVGRNRLAVHHDVARQPRAGQIGIDRRLPAAQLPRRQRQRHDEAVAVPAHGALGAQPLRGIRPGPEAFHGQHMGERKIGKGPVERAIEAHRAQRDVFRLTSEQGVRPGDLRPDLHLLRAVGGQIEPALRHRAEHRADRKGRPLRAVGQERALIDEGDMRVMASPAPAKPSP
jgi:hypothetical protein